MGFINVDFFENNGTIFCELVHPVLTQDFRMRLVRSLISPFWDIDLTVYAAIVDKKTVIKNEHQGGYHRSPQH